MGMHTVIAITCSNTLDWVRILLPVEWATRFACGGMLARLPLPGPWADQTPAHKAACLMKTTFELELADIKKIATAAEAEAINNQWPVTIAIVDAGGHLLWLQRLDGAAPVSAHIAPAKARTAALGRRESKVYEDIINNGRTAFLSAPEIDGLLEGGVPILRDGQCLGAVGVSGVKSAEDAQIARAGIAALAT